MSYIWPGAEEPRTGACSDGEWDHGGPLAITALRDVIRYALGDVQDFEGQRIADRVQGLAPSHVGVWAFSHPGIAAMNVLTQHGDALAEVAWFVGRENPTQDQHCAVELGHFSETGQRIVNPLYDFARDYGPDLYDLDLSTARWAADYVEAGHEDEPGRAYFDLDLDGFDEDTDHVLSFRVPTMWDKRYLSRSLTHALRDNGLTDDQWPADLATPEEADAAWAYRNSIDRFSMLEGSDLRTMIVFAERQHVQPLADAPSVHSAYDGFSGAGLWVRINPDLAYAEWAVGGAYPGYPDYDAGTEPTDWSTAGDTWGYPPAPGNAGADLGQAIGLAAVAEMADRTEFERWDANLEEVLIPEMPSP